jgi:hypothetical protein
LPAADKIVDISAFGALSVAIPNRTHRVQVFHHMQQYSACTLWRVQRGFLYVVDIEQERTSGDAAHGFNCAPGVVCCALGEKQRIAWGDGGLSKLLSSTPPAEKERFPISYKSYVNNDEACR